METMDRISIEYALVKDVKRKEDAEIKSRSFGGEREST